MNATDSGRRISGLTLAATATVFIAGLIAGGLVQLEGPHRNEAIAQPMRGGAGGVMAFTGQIGRDTHGIIMVDVDLGTLWVYQIKGNKLALVAARNWAYDRQLQEFNCEAPSPNDVAQLISTEEERQQPPGAETRPVEKAPK